MSPLCLLSVHRYKILTVEPHQDLILNEIPLCGGRRDFDRWKQQSEFDIAKIERDIVDILPGQVIASLAKDVR